MIPDIHFASRHESGNIFFILGLVRSRFYKTRQITVFEEIRNRVFASGSYDQALGIIREYVNLIDDDGVYT